MQALVSSTFSSEMHLPSGVYEWQMPIPSVEPMPPAPLARRPLDPLLAHDASYFAASARMASLEISSILNEMPLVFYRRYTER
jgi:hypothetical protein